MLLMDLLINWMGFIDGNNGDQPIHGTNNSDTVPSISWFVQESGISSTKKLFLTTHPN